MRMRLFAAILALGTSAADAQGTLTFLNGSAPVNYCPLSGHGQLAGQPVGSDFTAYLMMDGETVAETPFITNANGDTGIFFGGVITLEGIPGPGPVNLEVMAYNPDGSILTSSGISIELGSFIYASSESSRSLWAESARLPPLRRICTCPNSACGSLSLRTPLSLFWAERPCSSSVAAGSDQQSVASAVCQHTVLYARKERSAWGSQPARTALSRLTHVRDGGRLPTPGLGGPPSRSGAFVYRLGHGPLKAERRVRFPYALPVPAPAWKTATPGGLTPERRRWHHRWPPPGGPGASAG